MTEIDHRFDHAIDLIDRPFHRVTGDRACWCLPVFDGNVIIHRAFRADHIWP